MAISGKNGNVYSSALEIEDCEDVWVAGTGASSISVVTGKVGTYCVRDTTTTLGASALMMTEAIVKDLTAYDGVYFIAVLPNMVFVVIFGTCRVEIVIDIG